jgi:hypothetical protein
VAQGVNPEFKPSTAKKLYKIARITEVLDPKGLRKGMNR